MYDKSQDLFVEAKRYIPGGVNSPVRAFGQVGGTPVFMQSSKGAYLFDADGNQYIDFIGSWGPMILGHCHPKVVKALKAQVSKAISFGAPTDLEVEMAKLIHAMVPQVEMVRMVNSGTEACMSALRVARGYTGRSKFLKFEGHYHGHADAFLKKAGSGVATLGIKVVGGIPVGVSQDTLVAPFNDFEAVREIVAVYGDEMAAIIVEPVAGNMGCVLPEPGFLQFLRDQCDAHGIVLIFDEVMTGFRLASGGVQELMGVSADLVTFGKVIGGGLPVGAFGGKRALMERVAPLGDIYQAGTLSGNPLAMVAGLTTLGELHARPSIYLSLEKKTAYLAKGLEGVLTECGVAHTINRIGSMISVHYAPDRVVDFTTASHGNNETFRRYFHGLLDRGVYLPPSAFESWFLSDALSFGDLDRTVEATREVFM